MMLGSLYFTTTLFLIEIASCVRVYENEKIITICKVGGQYFSSYFYLKLLTIAKRLQCKHVY